jgi:hypothetical protein
MVTFEKEFENYILSGSDGDTLSTIVSGGQADLYLQVAAKIKELDKDKKLNPEIWTILQKYKKRVDSDVYESSKLVVLLKEYDLDSTTKERKEEILTDLKNTYYAGYTYSYSKPSHIQQNITSSDDGNKLKDTIDEDALSIKNALMSWYNEGASCVYSLPQFKEYSFTNHVDLMKLNDAIFLEAVLNSGYITAYHELSNDVLGRLAKLINSACEREQGLTLGITNLLNGLTYQQIELLMGTITSAFFDKNTLINSYINKRFSSKLSSATDDHERRAVLLQIYEYIKKQGSGVVGYKANLLLQLLENGMKINKYDLELFKEYVKHPVAVGEVFALKEEQVKTISNQCRYNICGENYVYTDKNVIETYLKHFLLHDGIAVDTLGVNLRHDFIQKCHYETLVLKGEDAEHIIEYLGHDQYEQLVKKTEISICGHNKPVFAIDETVVLDVDIKNIQTLFVKIFEINTENYYYNKKAPINTAMSLEGLITTYEETYSFNEKPQKIIRRQIELDKIPKRRGLYIVEMIGSGYSSRAIIKKGGLSIVTGPSPRGKVVFIVNESSEVCNTKSTGLWFKNTFYTAEPTTGGIMIPFMRQTFNENCILVHEGFAELANLIITEERYQLSGFFHFNHESLMMGNTAKILVKPYLTINNREARLDNLKNAKVTVLLTKIENEVTIPISNVFDSLVVNNDKEIEIEIQIPPKLVAVDFVFDAEIYNYSKETKESLNFRQRIDLNGQKEDLDIIRQYLRRKGDGYVINVLGKNGEPKTDQQLTIEFSHKHLLQPITLNLQTNEHGEVNIGDLKSVSSLTSTTNYLNRSICHGWEVPKEREFSYPCSIDILNTDSIVLPYDDVVVDKSLVRLNEIVNNGSCECIEDCLGNITLTPAAEGSTGRFNLSISGLTEGCYNLVLKNINKMINVNVYNGKVWKTNNFIILKDKIIENTDYKNPIQISKLNIEDGKINIKVTSHATKPRVNVFLYQFLHFESSTVLNKHKSLYQASQNTHNFQNWKNFYLSNRLLNEEIQYVFDRKYFERFIGNSLERPMLLMKRQYIRDTTTDTENVNKGTEYQYQEADLLCQKQPASLRQCSQMKQRMYSPSSCMPIRRADNLFSNFHNFLAHSPVILLNLIPNENGELVIDGVNLNEYSHLHIVAIDEKSISEENHSLKCLNIAKRSLTLNKPLDAEKTYSELRITEVITKDKSVTISDITSTKYKLIDSMDKFINFANLVNPSLTSEWSSYSFLLKLNELSDDERKKKLSSIFSHEINLFLYFKYPELFEKYTKPVLKYKTEKTFVDFFLLGNTKCLLEYCCSERLSTLNAFEKCLLIYAIRKENPGFAECIWNLINTNAESTKVGADELKRLFNILMNMKVEAAETEKASDFLIDLIEERNNRNNVVPMNCFNAVSLAMPRNEVMYDDCYAEEEECGGFGDMFGGGSYMEQKNYDMFDFASQKMAVPKLLKANAVNNLFREAGKSKEYCETHWRSLHFNISSILDNFFWSDLARFWLDHKDITLSKNFLSKNVLFRINNVSELLCILAVLDLPLQAINHQFNRTDGRSLEIIAKSNLVLFTKEIAQTDSKINSNLMIAQSITELNQPNSETIISEYIVNKIYVHETIVTNISSQNITFELLVQIPEGAMPVMNSEYTKTINQSLSRFNTTNYKTYFYFPQPGKFSQYPPNIAVDGTVISKAQVLVYNVVKSATIQSKESLDNVLEMGSKNDILEFISGQKSIKQSDLAKVYWLLKEKDFYNSLLDLLRKRGIYDTVVWSFGFYHKDESAIRELISQNKNIRDRVGPCFNTGLLTVNETNNHDNFNHLDYHPIINARVHRLGQDNKLAILNREFKETYQSFIMYLIFQTHINSKAWLRLSYYLILQDRIEDALKAFSRIDVTEFNDFYSLQIQYDYIAAYLDFSTGYPEFKKAKEICRKYKDFPLTQ